MYQFVEIDGKKYHIYACGQGPVTVVFLSGSGVPFPDLEYKSLAEPLSTGRRGAIIEKLGVRAQRSG